MLITSGTAWNTLFCMQFCINRSGYIFRTNQLRKTHLNAISTPPPGTSNPCALQNFKHILVWQRPWGNIWYLLLLIEALLLGETHDEMFHQYLWDMYKRSFPVSAVFLRTCNRRGREGINCPWVNLWYLLLLIKALHVGETHDDLITKISETTGEDVNGWNVQEEIYDICYSSLRISL